MNVAWYSQGTGSTPAPIRPTIWRCAFYTSNTQYWWWDALRCSGCCSNWGRVLFYLKAEQDLNDVYTVHEYATWFEGKSCVTFEGGKMKFSIVAERFTKTITAFCSTIVAKSIRSEQRTHLSLPISFGKSSNLLSDIWRFSKLFRFDIDDGIFLIWLPDKFKLASIAISPKSDISSMLFCDISIVTSLGMSPSCGIARMSLSEKSALCKT